MKAETVYIFVFESDTESTRVAAGLFQKFGTRATHGVVVKIGDENTYTVTNMKKGNPPLKEGIEQSTNTNFKKAWRAVKNEPAPAAAEPAHRVGVYLVSHGMLAAYWDPSPVEMVDGMQAVMPDDMFVLIEKISLVKCMAVEREETGQMLQFLQLLKDRGCRPQVAAWDTMVTASPGDPEQHIAEHAQASVGKKFIKPGDAWVPAKAEREQHKRVFQLNAEGALVSGPPSVFRQPV